MRTVLSRIYDFFWTSAQKKKSRTFLTGVNEFILVHSVNRMSFREKTNLLIYVITYLLTYLLTSSKKQSLSWEADRF